MTEVIVKCTSLFTILVLLAIEIYMWEQDPESNIRIRHPVHQIRLCILLLQINLCELQHQHNRQHGGKCLAYLGYPLIHRCLPFYKYFPCIVTSTVSKADNFEMTFKFCSLFQSVWYLPMNMQWQPFHYYGSQFYDVFSSNGNQMPVVHM